MFPVLVVGTLCGRRSAVDTRSLANQLGSGPHTNNPPLTSPASPKTHGLELMDDEVRVKE